MPGISPPRHGVYLFDLAEPVLLSCRDGGQEELKRISELSMALHYVRLFYPRSIVPPRLAGNLARRLMEQLHGENHLRLLGNSFVLQQHVTPYIFLRSRRRRSDYYEGLVASFVSSELEVRECTPYRGLERAHLLYKLGAAPLVAAFSAPIFVDAAQVFYFNRDLSYALTHTLFYSTDFSHQLMPDAHARFACTAVAAASFEANDTDLCFEACLCLMSQDLAAAALAELWAMIGAMRQRNAALFDGLNPLEDYHPLLVFDMLRGAALRRHGIDLEEDAAELPGDPGPIRSLGALCAALRSKDIARIEACYLAYVAVTGDDSCGRDLAASRLATLRMFARNEVLFEREFAYLGRRDLSIYGQYLFELDQLGIRQPQLLS